MSAITSAALTGAVIVFAARFRIVDSPAGHRWNKASTPTLGGIAILAAAALFSLPQYAPPVRLFVAGIAIVFIAGLLDDIWGMGPKAKLASQIVAATLAVLSGVSFNVTGIPPVDAAFTIFWIVAFTNAFNLTDNMDGLCAGVSALSAVALSAHAAIIGNMPLAAALLALSGACSGFLFYNLHPARIFMGDCGSMALGYALAVAAAVVSAGYSRGPLESITIPLLALSVPAMDTAFVTVTRLARGQSIAAGGRDHISHRVASLGLSDRRVAFVLHVMALALGAASIFQVYSCVAALVFVILASVALLGVLLWRVTPDGRQAIAKTDQGTG